MRLDTMAMGDAEWAGYVLGHPRATIFHHPAWTSVITDCYGLESMALVARDGSGRIVGGVPVTRVRTLLGPKRWVALPFTDACPPLLSDGGDIDEFTALLVRAAHEARIGSFEVREALPLGPHVHRIVRGVIQATPLPEDPAECATIPSSHHRKNTKVAIRDGVTVRMGSALEDARGFYDLHAMTRRRLGVPVQPRRFFDLIAQRLLARDLGFVMTAEVEDRPISAALFLTFNRTLTYKFSAADRDFSRHRPNNLVISEAMRWACENGYHTLDWGRADLQDQGLRDYKAGWGAVETPLEYSYVAERAPQPSIDHVNPLARSVISHSPIWVCRMLGELLYRWAA